MKFDTFFSICQTEVDGYMPDEKTMLNNFFDQVKLADELGYGVAWIAETHLSTEVQKQNSNSVIPHFKGEIGLNTDIFQMAHKVFSMTKNIEVGSAICNILCNGGPLARAEAIRTFLSLHGLNPDEKRKLHLGFASGRFDFSNAPYGVKPRNEFEQVAWKAIKGKVLHEATEIFLKAFRGDEFSSNDITPKVLKPDDFRESQDWENAANAYMQMQQLEKPERKRLEKEGVPVEPFWTFEDVGVIPKEAPLHLANLVLGSHDPTLQEKANKFWPVSVFNLSITPSDIVEETHARMRQIFHPDGGIWQRWFMPRTCMVFLNDDEGLSQSKKDERAKAQARSAWENYWKAMKGTINEERVEQAVENAVAGSPETITKLVQEKYHPEDRLMLWFDFNNHDNEAVKKEMKVFMNKVAPELRG